MFKSESCPSPIWEMGNILDNSIPSFWIWHALWFDFSSNVIAGTISYTTDSYAPCGIVGKGGDAWLIGTKNADQWMCRLDGWNLQMNKTFSSYLYQGLIILDVSVFFTAWQRALEAEGWIIFICQLPWDSITLETLLPESTAPAVMLGTHPGQELRWPTCDLISKSESVTSAAVKWVFSSPWVSYLVWSFFAFNPTPFSGVCFCVCVLSKTDFKCINVTIELLHWLTSSLSIEW